MREGIFQASKLTDTQKLNYLLSLQTALMLPTSELAFCLHQLTFILLGLKVGALLGTWSWNRSSHEDFLRAYCMPSTVPSIRGHR